MEMLYLAVPATIIGGMAYLDLMLLTHRAEKKKRKLIRTQSLPAFWEDAR